MKPPPSFGLLTGLALDSLRMLSGGKPLDGIECPRCGELSLLSDWEDIDLGVGVQRFLFAWACPTHGEFAPVRDESGFSTGEYVFEGDCASPDLGKESHDL